MCAALQYATTADLDAAPVLLRTEVDAGHGARAVSRSVALSADTLAFLARHTGLQIGETEEAKKLAGSPTWSSDSAG